MHNSNPNKLYPFAYFHTNCVSVANFAQFYQFFLYNFSIIADGKDSCETPKVTHSDADKTVYNPFAFVMPYFQSRHCWPNLPDGPLNDGTGRC